MKSKITLVLLLVISSWSYAQIPLSKAIGIKYTFNPEESECVTDSERSNIITSLKSNITLLKEQKKLKYTHSKSGNHPLFIWPLQKASTSNYNEIYGISGYVDHNTSFPNQLTDYNCGTRSYDTNSGYNHQGVDMFTWPFGWKMMDNDEVEIIAAAPGQIVAKNDGEFDRSCNFNSNIWNAVYVQHSDGSVAWYGHMKNGSTTSKNVGDTVSEGEYLGIVGSSGNSTGPHLHFEVYSDASFTQLVDPYTGSCNSMNSDSWWQTQRPYNNPGINAALTHSAPPIFNACPITETTNEDNDFDTDDTIYFALYVKDQVANDNIQPKLIRPDNSVVYDWDFNVNTTSAAWYYYWSFSGIFNMNGEWKWEATYNGETVTHTFNVTGVLSVDEEDFSTTSIYPNPFYDIVTISSKTKVKNVKIIDVLGKVIKRFKENSTNGIKELNLTELSNGLYFINLEGEQNQKKTIKLVKR